jgi:hypothetical protein
MPSALGNATLSRILGVAASAFIPDAPVSNRQGYHPELLIYACIGKEPATLQ